MSASRGYEKPGVPLSVSVPGSLPKSLCELDQFVLWRDEDGVKVPYGIDGKRASHSDPTTWSSYQEVVDVFKSSPGGYSGIGFVFTENDDLVGIDFDDCVDTNGIITATAAGIVARLHDCYAEFSPSGTGIKVWVYGNLARAVTPIPLGDGSTVELYSRERYFTLTGKALPNSPLEINYSQGVIDDLLRIVEANSRRKGGSATGDVQQVVKIAPYVDKVVESEIRTIEAAEPGSQNLTLNRSAWNAGRLSEYIDTRRVEKQLIDAGMRMRNEPGKRPWNTRDVSHVVQAGMRSGSLQPRTLIERRLAAVSSTSTEDQHGGNLGQPRSMSLSPETFNDSGNADRAILRCGNELRFCHGMRTWLWWNGTKWEVDTTGRARKYAKLTIADFYKQAVNSSNEAAQKFATRSLDEKRISNMLRMAECEIFVEHERLDRQNLLINFLNGTFDVSTGEFREHRRADFLTKRINHNFISAAKCPLFLRTLNRLMGVGPDAAESELERADRLVGYLQRALGYSLTGDVTGKAVFMVYGKKGNNGKSTMLSVVARLAEEYSVQIDINTLMVRQETNNSQSDLARLRGARFAKTSETEEGQRLAEGKLKRIVQGQKDGKISATRKYENAMEFVETHKLWMDCNHLPVIKGTEDAIWNRLKVIPFVVTIPDEEIDPDLGEKLVANEAEGILAWLVVGACQWYKSGLRPPVEIRAAQSQYREQMDPISDFLDEYCVLGSQFSVMSNPLYKKYADWAIATNQSKVLSDKDFKRLMEDGKACIYKHTNSGTRVQGVGFRAADLERE